MIALLDYGAGNVRSVRNAIAALGYSLADVRTPEDILTAERLIFPGVGAFGPAMQRLRELGFEGPLREYLRAGRPFLGICIGLQSLFEGSEESPGVAGLGLIPGLVKRFDNSVLSVPHMGWNGLRLQRECELLEDAGARRFYFVHSYFAEPDASNRDWVLAETDYGRPFISAVQRGEVAAVQFHPEKSGAAGLEVLRRFLAGQCILDQAAAGHEPAVGSQSEPTALAKRIIACLDVRTNDHGDLVVTKGDQYDVREQGEVRNLGKPVDLAKRYYDEGADEITFLNITAFRDFPLVDQPMLKVLRRASEQIFVPLTIGGGIRAFTDQNGQTYSALGVATEYFRSGADKVSIGSEAVLIAEAFHARGGHGDGSSAIEQIARVYGNQAVVISVDPRRVYVESPEASSHHCIQTLEPGPNGEGYCWFQCTIKGGREGRDLDVLQLVQACEQLGAGEILVNSIDRDGSGRGFDLELLKMVRAGVRIPVIASSGAGCPEHFTALFAAVDVEAALAAGIFHRREVPIAAVKRELSDRGVSIRA
ncbi:imidazole glycerol phosphate synthase HisHF [Thiorhodovibrio frisius]|uniref:Imidazole glycerol phosphate synthase subunit HisH n=1 Tax=Thiorhodovibrio frisius TaxID=631362 RepID=H8Z4I2_9GAMM|nr:imidazole glycerol phosphate synthase HisHF [Thiorhodovibrio frisius]EIC20239.1 imidazole glycerol phosphate synthase, glutamine amidotransferase subunit [Thiorhodovibrio frisius]WPL20976.1 Imidazole glycerol phosphate synthase subunit HisF [Thiorhodovibrio frisius]